MPKVESVYAVGLYNPADGITYVIAPWLTGANARDAHRELEELGLVADFSGPMENSEVVNQMPDGNTAVEKGSKVHLLMQEVTYQ
jgi:beta-lactam-binding protein with PASTA domain